MNLMKGHSIRSSYWPHKVNLLLEWYESTCNALWGHSFVDASVSPYMIHKCVIPCLCEHNRESCCVIFWSNLAYMLSILRGWSALILEVKVMGKYRGTGMQLPLLTFASTLLSSSILPCQMFQCPMPIKFDLRGLRPDMLRFPWVFIMKFTLELWHHRINT